MKPILSAIFAIACYTLSAQSFELSGVFTTSGLNEFRNTFGTELGYNFGSKSNHYFSLQFSYCQKKAYYDDIWIDEESIGPLYPMYYFTEYTSKGKRFGIHFYYDYLLINNEKSALKIGTGLAYYNFYYYKEYELMHYRFWADTLIYQCSGSFYESKRNKIGVNLHLEFALKSVVFEKLDLFTRIKGEFISYGYWGGIEGVRSHPWLTEWVTVNLGVRYNFKSVE